MSRHCARSGCNTTSAATLSYDYAASMVWIEHLHLDSHPMTHDLCVHHADTTTVPVGWELRDVRVNDLSTQVKPHSRHSAIARAS
ncbi:MAG: DUF3499 family protein [Acidobacteria bacterium]|nr:DUF3499 family protein [Acidobacteriota bacterium]